jgi:hypothetical protein
MVESFGGASIRPFRGSEIYQELVEVTDPTYSAPSDDTQSNMCLLGAILFKKILPTLIGAVILDAIMEILAVFKCTYDVTGRLESAVKSNEMSVLLTSYLREK